MKRTCKKSRRIISGLILSSILGFSLQAVPVQAATVSINGNDVKTETGDTSGYGITTTNTENPAIGNGPGLSVADASGNTVNITDGAIASKDSGADIFGGLVLQQTGNSDQTQVSNNTVNLTNTTIGDGTGSVNVFGAYVVDNNEDTYAYSDEELSTWNNQFTPKATETFDISHNTVTIKGAAPADGTNVSIYGGAAYVTGSSPNRYDYRSSIKVTANAPVTYNAVYIGTSAAEEAASTYATSGNNGSYDTIFGGYTSKGTAANNTVVVRNSTLTNLVAGGYTESMTADANQVTLSDITAGEGLNIYGGCSLQGSVTDNVVTLTDVDGSAGSVIAAGGIASGANVLTGDATDNQIHVTDSTLYIVAGGISAADGGRGNSIVGIKGIRILDFQAPAYYYNAIGNLVFIDETKPNTMNITGAVYGGVAFGYARKNEVHVTSGTTSAAIGGYSLYKDATDNIVTIGSADFSTSPVVGTTLIGGLSDSGSTTGNKVYVYGSTIGSNTNPVAVETLPGVGWSIKTLPNGVIAGGLVNTNDSFFDDDSADSSNNEVYISHSTIEDGITEMYGGLGVTAANNNTVTLADTSITLGDSALYQIPSSSTEGIAADLKSRIVGGEAENGSASGNTVTITGTDTTIDNIGEIIGGRTFVSQYTPAETAAASGNTVSISDATITGTTPSQDTSGLTIYAGNGISGASDNTLSITDATLKNVSSMYGSYTSSGAASGTTVSFSNSHISGDSMNVVGAKGDTEANNNTFSVTNHTELVGISQLIGSNSKSGSVSGNTFSISDSLLSNEDGFYIIGSQGHTEAVNNNLYITDSKLSGLLMLYGAYGESDAYNNTEVLTNATITDTYRILGNAGGYAHDNAFSIIGGSLTFAAGLLVGTVGEIEATQNTMTLSQTNISGAATIYGGYSNTTVSDNAVTISDTTISNIANDDGTTIAAGVSTGVTATAKDDESKTILPGADDNSIYIDGGSVDVSRIYGGWLQDSGTDVEGTTDSNTVSIGEGVTAGTVIGGNNELGGSSSKNTVTINGGTVEENVVAGQTTAGDASGNTLDIYDGTIGTTDAAEGNTNLIAAAYTKDGAADSNTVNVYGGTLGVMMSLYGGYTPADKAKSTNNTLNLYTKDNTVENLGYFQNLNFYVPEGTTAGETMIEVTNTADVSGAAITAGVYDNTQIRPGQVINLIHDSANGVTTDGNTTYSMMSGRDYVVTPGLVRYNVLIKKQDPETVVLYIPEDSQGTIIPATKIMTSQRRQAVNTVTDVTDTASTSGYETAIATWKAEMGSHAGWDDHEVWKKYTPYVLLGGHDLRYDTDSTTNTQGFNSELGFVKRSYHDDYIDTYMPFLEYGNGNYTERYQGARGDGNQQYIGAGFLVRRDRTDGLHYEAVLRAGQLNTDYHADIAGHHISYDTDTNYIAAQLGLGKLYTHKDNDYDIYTKLFWSHIFSDDVDIYSDLGKAQYQFDSADSVRSRIGFRWTKHYQENQTYYAGLGWDHEFDGTARASYNNFDLPESNGKGDAGFLELGWSSKSHADNPWNADVKLRGWVGMKKGIDYTITIGRAF